MTLVIDPSELEVYGEDYDYYYGDYSDDVISAQREAVNDEINNANTGYITIEGVGILDIPSIELHVPIWETTNSDTLRYGVGHYVNSVSPGSYGNCTIVGHHMLKYGSIFNRLEEVEIGDIINAWTDKLDSKELPLGLSNAYSKGQIIEDFGNEDNQFCFAVFPQ